MHNQQVETTTIPFSPENIVQAFQVISNPQNPKETIATADSYLSQCEKNSQFPFCLMSIIKQSQNVVLKKQAIILLKNVIKRNWNSRRRATEICHLTEEMKAKIKANILGLYMEHWKTSTKDLNQILKYLTRQDYPLKYPELHEFMKHILNTLVHQDLNSIVNSDELLPFLSTVKVIMKEYANKRIVHNKDIFQKYINEILQISVQIEEKISQAIYHLKSQPKQNINVTASKNILECSRKIDKIILYSLQSIVSELQMNPALVNIAKSFVQKMTVLLDLLYSWAQVYSIREQIELNVLAIIEQLSKLQSYMPFLFSSFLEQYINNILKLFLQANFEHQRLTDTIIQAINKLLLTYCYYKNQKQFKESIYYKKENAEVYLPLQSQCHQIFKGIFGGMNSGIFLQKIITIILSKYERQNEEDEMLFEDSETASLDTNQDIQTFQLVIILTKNFINRFKEECIPILRQILNNLIEEGSEKKYNRRMYMNMGQVVLLIPRIYEEEEIPYEAIVTLMQKTFSIEEYNLFVRLIRNYQTYLNISFLCKCFNILTQIILSPNANHKILYQSAVCIKRILNQHEESELSVENLGHCLVNIIKLLSLYKNNPNHLWNLITLITQLLKSLSTQTVINITPLLITALRELVNEKGSKETTICGLIDLLQSLMDTVSFDQKLYNYDLVLELSVISFKLIDDNIERQDLQNLYVLFLLWLRIIKEYDSTKSPQQLNGNILQLFSKHKGILMNEDTTTFIEIIEEYMISGLLSLNRDDVMSLFESILSKDNLEHQNRLFMSLFSFYLTFSTLTNSFIQQILILGMEQLISILNKISPSDNALRTQILLAINHHIIIFRPETIFQIFNQKWPDYKQWYWAYIWSSSYISHKYAYKLNTIATLSSLHLLQNQILRTPINGQYPFDIVLKNITIQVQPFKVSQAMMSYHTSQRLMYKSDQLDVERNRRHSIGFNSNRQWPRKIKLHVNKDWSQADLSNMYRQKVGNLLNLWDWAEDDLQERFHESTVEKMVRILKGKSEEVD